MLVFDNGLSEEDLKPMKLRRNIYTAVWAILLVLGGVTGTISWYLSTGLLILACIAAGLGMFCINNIRYVQTKGRKTGGGLWWLLLFVFGFFILNTVTVLICSKISPLARLILGIKN